MIEWIMMFSVLILLIMLLRVCLWKRLAARVRYALWLVVMVRLLLPVSVDYSPVSILIAFRK